MDFDPKQLTQEEIMKFLYTCYDKAINGILFISPAIDKVAQEYLDRHHDLQHAAKSMLNNQVLKCATSGFITGFGGVLSMPVTIPANLASVIYVQIRMIACAAYMAGYDLHDDQTQTFVYTCLAGVSVNEVLKKFGVQFGKKMAEQGIKKIPRAVLTKINQKLGFRFITKFGEKGLINLGKMIPVVGAGINGGLDFVETKAIAARAYKTFINGDFSVGDPLIIEIEDDENTNI